MPALNTTPKTAYSNSTTSPSINPAAGLGRHLIDALHASYLDATIEGNTTPEAAPFYTALGFDLSETGDRTPTGAAILRFTRTPSP